MRGVISRGLAALIVAPFLLVSACGAPATQAASPPSGATSATPAVASGPSSASATSPAPAGDAVVTSDPFGGYAIDLPQGTLRTGAKVGRWGDTRTMYRTPAGESITTIDFSPDFGWSELSEELTSTCPGASEGPQESIQWGGSDPGGYTGWDRSSCRQSDIVTFVDFSDEGVSVIYDADSPTPAAWIVSAHQTARRVTGIAGHEVRFLIDHRNDRRVDLAVWAEACGKAFGSASDIATAFATEARLSGAIYGDGGPVCEYGQMFFGIADVRQYEAPSPSGWSEFGADDCRFQDVALFFFECRRGDLVVHAGLRKAPTDNDRAQMARIVRDVRDQLPTS